MPQPAAWVPEGLTKSTSTAATPERLSVTCAVTVTVAELVVVSTAIGLNVKLVSTGGCVSCASAGSAATEARSSRDKILTEFRAKLRCPHADMRLPPAACLLSDSILQSKATTQGAACGGGGRNYSLIARLGQESAVSDGG